MKRESVGDRYRPDIDGLRAIAVLPVVLYHLGIGFTGGYVGVDIFFVISGYLITGIIKREIDLGTFTFARFYERRVRRLFPALFAMLACVLIAGWWLLLPSDLLIASRAAIATVAFCSNVLLWRSAGYFAPDSTLNPLLHTWSLAVEEQFYVLFPIFLLACCRFLPRYVRWVTWLAALLSFGISVVAIKYRSAAVFYLTPFRAWELAVGCLLALDAIRPIDVRWMRELAGFLGLALICVAVFAYSPATEFPGWAALLPVLGAALLLHCGASGDSIASRVLSIRWLVYIGAISYSLYLWHWPIIVFARFLVGMAPLGIRAWGLLAISLLLATASYHLVEQPFRRRRVGVSRRSLFMGAAAAMCMLFTMSAFGLLMHGAPGRFDAQTVQLDRDRYSKIPFKECDSRPSAKWKNYCVIGDTTQGVPVWLIWGDSHALSWGPAFDLILKQQRQSAYFVPNSACPPFGVRNRQAPQCRAETLAVKNFINQERNLKGVVIAGVWNVYFTEGSQYTLSDEFGRTGNPQVAAAAMDGTLRYLKSCGLATILLEDVPGAPGNVPLTMALQRAFGAHGPKLLTPADYRASNAAFEQEATLAASSGLAVLVPVEQWFCLAGICRVQEAGFPLYRDKTHLSLSGSMSRAAQLGTALVETRLFPLSRPVAAKDN